MKVKELITMLQQLDQEKNIWIIHDCYPLLEFDSVEVASESDCWQKEDRDKVGDYYLEAL